MVAIQTSANKKKRKKERLLLQEPKSVFTPRLVFNYTYFSYKLL